MFDVWKAVLWWDEWQLRILVLGSLAIQWILLVAAPMRKYTIPRFFRSCIWLAYISSDALAIYALATLFNRHANATTSNGACGGIASKGSILEILWAPILLIHLGGQEDLTAYSIEDNEMWTRHTVTLVSQVAVALYAFYKSWPSSSDWKLLASAVVLFLIGVLSFSQKPWALNRARIRRLAAVSAKVQGTEKRSKWDIYMDDLLFSDFAYKPSFLKKEWYKWPTKSGNKRRSGPRSYEDGKQSDEVLSVGDRVFMILSDMSLTAAADDLERRKKANKDEVLKYMGPRASRELRRWLRGAFGFIYTRANMVVHPVYQAYKLLAVPTFHIVALTLFATSDKQAYNRTDVKVTYILLCFTAAMDILAVFIRQLMYWVMFVADVPTLCETMRRYNLVDAAFHGEHKAIGRLARNCMRCTEECFDCKGRGEGYKLYKRVSDMAMADLVTARALDPASYRIFTVPEPVTAEVEIVDAMTPDPETTVDAAELEILHLGEEPSELPENNSRAPREELGAAGTEKIQQSRAAPTQKTIHRTEETRITISPGGSSFNTPDDGHKTTDQKEEPWSGGQMQHAMELQLLRPPSNWALDEELQEVCGPEIRKSLRGSFDRSVLVWHIATDLLFRMDPDNLRHGRSDDENVDWIYMESAEAISNYMAHLLNFHTEMLLTGSRHHLVTEAVSEIKSIVEEIKSIVDGVGIQPEDIVEKGRNKKIGSDDAAGQSKKGRNYFHVPEACKLANELRDLRDPNTRWKLIYRVWLGMLFYSASMCRGYLHAKSLGEGGEFLSFIWLFLSLRGAKTLADKLQMLEGGNGSRS